MSQNKPTAQTRTDATGSAPAELTDVQLEVSAGRMLVPAVQKVR